MAITEDRMLRLITAAESLRDASRGLWEALTSWRDGALSGKLTATQVIDSAQRYLATTLPNPHDLATIEVERRHFDSHRSRNAYSRRRMAALRDGEPRKRTKRTGYETKPHDPTGHRTAPAPPHTMPRNAEELAAHVAEAERQMAVDKAELAARAVHKPKPLPFAPPRAAPTNPYENDGMPDVPPGVTAEDLLKAGAKANEKTQNSPSTELTTEPTRAILQLSEQGIPPEPDKAL